MAKDEVVSQRADPERFGALQLALPVEIREGDPLYGEFGRCYYPAVFGDRLGDRSFALVGRDGSSIVVECDVLDGVLGRFGMPIRLAIAGAQGAKAEQRLLRLAVAELRRIADGDRVSQITLADDESAVVLSSLGRACLAADFRAGVRLHACVDLSMPDAGIQSELRSSYRSLVNWGARSLTVRYCNSEHPDREVFGAYEKLHEQVAGRRTRPQASWDVMFEFVARGSGELTLASLEDEVVAGMLVFDGARNAHYGSAAYVRERFDHPLAHWPLFNAILRAKARGLRWFDIGHIPHRDDVSDKEASISFFKLGFTNRIEARVVWSLQSDTEEDFDRRSQVDSAP